MGRGKGSVGDSRLLETYSSEREGESERLSREKEKKKEGTHAVQPLYDAHPNTRYDLYLSLPRSLCLIASPPLALPVPTEEFLDLRVTGRGAVEGCELDVCGEGTGTAEGVD